MYTMKNLNRTALIAEPTTILIKDYHNKIALARIIRELVGNLSSKKKNTKLFSLVFLFLNDYSIIAISPPEPSFMILSNVSLSLYLAFSGINDSFA